MTDIPKVIAKQLNLNQRNVENTLALLDEGATVPFISRYRKEATGSLNEIEIRDIQQLYTQLIQLDKRKEYIIGVIERAGALTPDLKERISQSLSMTEIEDLYLPYKPRRRTRATVAREKGLEPLAKMIMAQTCSGLSSLATRFVKGEVTNAEEAIAGASDIIAEWVSESARARQGVRRQISQYGNITARLIPGKESEAAKYKTYHNFTALARKCPSHQILAMMRAQREGVLKVSLDINNEAVLSFLDKVFLKSSATTDCKTIVKDAVRDSYKRLMLPSIENEIWAEWKKNADTEAIRLFADNLRQLLLMPPLWQKRVMGIDPGFRTGCKIVCLDQQGNLLHDDVIYPQRERVTSARKICDMIEKYEIDTIALGNGTASRETLQFLQVIHMPREVNVTVVSESGASVYSASDLARHEFPDKDVTVRGAVSIGRRLIDPLAELVKIDPRSIGVGQYQHDVDQGALRDSLEYTVQSCVNSVGVNINTASACLLSYISGIGQSLAENIVAYRAEHGDFTSRRQLLNVPRLGDKAFQQAAGFMRIPESENPLDNSAVHPESYHIVKKMADDLGVGVEKLVRNEDLIGRIEISDYTSLCGEPTLRDIIEELKRPGLDPRIETEEWEFDKSISTIEDVRAGMVVNGVVNNITAFGAFVDIGVHESGLVHISELSDKRVRNVADVVKLNQHVKVKVLDVDLDRNRISLSMKNVDA